ncbi:hypothetical protein C0995_004004 [Termitomyces sp. Mi166|nr:hypothetical protein C0995_004004 [Termitomyces sp. Mi166\
MAMQQLGSEEQAKESVLCSALLSGINVPETCKSELANCHDAVDPGLNHEYAYYVKNMKFKAYLKEFGTKVEDNMNTCNNHNAIKSTSIQGGKSMDVSGVEKAECTWHDMERPISVGDLQKGEQ